VRIAPNNFTMFMTYDDNTLRASQVRAVNNYGCSVVVSLTNQGRSFPFTSQPGTDQTFNLPPDSGRLHMVTERESLALGWATSGSSYCPDERSRCHERRHQCLSAHPEYAHGQELTGGHVPANVLADGGGK
jgi:hypothetical protein